MNDPMGNLKKTKVSVKTRLAELGIILPAPLSPAGSYCMATRSGNVLYLSGHLPIKDDGSIAKGKVGKAVTTEEANSLARGIAINMLSTIEAEAGELDKVKILKAVGFVNCVDEYPDAPKVVNGFSEFMVDVFGEKHARSAVGTNALPLNVPVEIEAIVEICS